jgi:hypothetical protein
MNQYEDKFEAYLIRTKEELRLLNCNLKDKKRKFKILSKKEKNLILSRTVINKVFILCGNEAKSIIEDIVTLSLQTVYGEKYKFKLKQQVKYNKTEFRPYILKNNKERRLRTSGIVDVISFGFRLAVWALKSKQMGNFWFDEPFKFIQKNKEPVVGQMMAEIGNLLNIQTVMTTHSESLGEIGDKTYRVVQEKDISHAVKLK